MTKGIYKSFLKWAEAVRWIYFWAKQRDFREDVENNFEKKPWYQGTDRKAPLASPAIEAFLDKCERDLSDPGLRNKIKDNYLNARSET